MKTITVITPANIEIEYRLAGAGSRLAAFTIDFMIQIAACLCLAAIFLFGIAGYRFSALDSLGGYTLALFIIACFIIYFGYFVVCELTMNGQSPGKKLFGLRVIRDNGQPVSLSQSLVRNLFRAALDMLYIGLFFILFNKKHKRIGDIAAGTVVVSEHSGHWEQQSHPIPQSSNNSLIPQFKHVRLTEDEQRLLNSYLRRKDTLPEEGTAARGQIIAYLSKKWQIDATLLDDEMLALIGNL